MRARCGIEVSSDALKYVVLGENWRRRRLVGYGRVALEEGQSAGEVLRRLHEEGRIPATRLRVALGTQASILRVLNLPSMPPRDLARVVQGEVAKELQILTEEMSSGYQVLRRPAASDRRPVLVALTPRAGLQAFEREVRSFGLQVETLTTTSLGLLGYVRGLRDLEEGEEAVAVLHLGSDRMVLAVLQGGVFRQFRDLGVGLDASLLGQRQATGTDGTEVDWDALDQIGRGLDEISHVAAQIARTLQVDARAHEGRPVRRLYLAGDVTRGEAMAPILQNEVGLPVKVLDPLAGMALDREEPEFAREAASFALPLALARTGRTGTVLHLGAAPASAPPVGYWAAAAGLAIAGLIIGTVASGLEGRGYLNGLQRAAKDLSTREEAAGNQPGLAAWARDAGVGPRAPLEWIGRNAPAAMRATRVDLVRQGAYWGVQFDGTVTHPRSEGRLAIWMTLADSLARDARIADVRLQPLAGERPARRRHAPVTGGFRFQVKP